MAALRRGGEQGRSNAQTGLSNARKCRDIGGIVGNVCVRLDVLKPQQFSGVVFGQMPDGVFAFHPRRKLVS